MRWGDTTHKVTWHFDIAVKWQIKKVISPLLQCLCTPNLAGWWLRMRGPHLQSHVNHVVTCQVKTLYLHIHKACGVQNLAACWIRMRESHPKKYVELQLCGHVKNQNHHIFSTTGPSRCKSKACDSQK